MFLLSLSVSHLKEQSIVVYVLGFGVAHILV